MKKLHRIIAIVGAGFILAITPGCSESVSFPDVQAAADEDAAVQYRGNEYKCHIRYIDKDTASVTLLSPEEISGLTFTRSNDGCACSLGSLMCRGGSLSSASLAGEVFRVYDTLASSEPEPVKKCDDGSYEFTCDGMKIYTDVSGRVLSLKDKELKIN